MSQWIAALPTPFAGDSPLSAARDAIAADMIEKAADEGNEGAQEFAAEVNSMLGRAYVHRQRSRRLRRRARHASRMGYHDLTEVAGLFAGAEDTAAMREEALASSALRGTHDTLGYLTDSEKKFLARKKAEASWSTAQAEEVMESLLNRLYDAAANYGMEETYGVDSDLPEPEEVGEEDIDRLDAMIDSFGGDMHLVFGDGCYGEVMGALAASEERLQRRRARLKKRLEKLEIKLDEKEEAGKTGLVVKLLSKRIEWLENRIEKITSKLHKTKRAEEKTADASDEAQTIRAAESSSIKTSSRERRAVSPDEVSEIEEELEAFDEFGMGAEISVFGLSERRSQRVLRRLTRLEHRLAKVSQRNLTPRRQRRLARLQRRVSRLRAKLQGAELTQQDGRGGYTSMVTQAPSGYSTEEYVNSFFGGSLNQVERQPFVAYFARRSERLGAHPESGFGQEGSAADGFFESLSNFFTTVFVDPVKSLFTPAKRTGRADRRGVAKGKVQSLFTEDKRAGRADRRQGRRTVAKGKVKTYMTSRRARIERTKEARTSARSQQHVADLRQASAQARAQRRQEATSAWKSETPVVSQSRQAAAQAGKNVRLAARAARRNEERPELEPVELRGTDGWADYTMEPETKVITFVHPDNRKNIVVRDGATGHADIIEKVNFTPAPEA